MVTAADGQIDSRYAGLIRIGGIAFILTGLAYATCVVLTRFVPATSGTTESYLTATAGSFGVVCALWAVYMVSDVLLVPALIAMFMILRRAGGRALLLIGTALVGGYLVFDIGITEPNWLALAAIAHGFAGANVHDQAAYMGAAQYGLALVPFVNALSFGISGLGFLFISFVMLRSAFRRSTAIFGMAVMVLSMVAAVSWFATSLQLVISAVLGGFSLWCVVVGAQMYRMGSRAAAERRQPRGAGLRTVTG